MSEYPYLLEYGTPPYHLAVLLLNVTVAFAVIVTEESPLIYMLLSLLLINNTVEYCVKKHLKT